MKQDDHGDLSSVNMDTAVAIRTLEATYKSSADAASVEAMIIKLTDKVCCFYLLVYLYFSFFFPFLVWFLSFKLFFDVQGTCYV